MNAKKIRSSAKHARRIASRENRCRSGGAIAAGLGGVLTLIPAKKNNPTCGFRGERFRLGARRAGAEESSLVNQAVMNGVEGQFQTIGNAELVEDVVEVIFHCLPADKEFFADFAVSKSLRHELDDFFFAVAQQRLFAALA